METLWEENKKYRGYSAKKYSIAETFGRRFNWFPYIRKYGKLSENELIQLLKQAKEGQWEYWIWQIQGFRNYPMIYLKSNH